MVKATIGALYFLTFLCVAFCGTDLIVHTKYGSIRGLLHNYDKHTVYQFLKVPYAKPPIGDRRFRKPVPVDPWNDVIDGTKHPPSCIQNIPNMISKLLPTTEISEDCLFLNVYVPYDMSSGKRRSVMVWIHGGSFHFGQASMFDGSYLALTGDVIVVTLNYRLNVFGFLTTWDSAAPGNYGLWDQISGLQWIQDTMESFGGNPQSITIFGESVGGVSVSFLATMSRNRGLFHRVIAQSGLASSPWAYNNKHRSYINTIIEESGCKSNNADSFYVLECLRQVPAERFLNVSDKMISAGVQNDWVVPLSPRVDGDLISDNPKNSFASTSEFFRSLDFLAGFTDSEGIDILLIQDNEKENLGNLSDGISTEYLCDIFAPKISRCLYGNSTDIATAVCKMYSVTTDKIKQAEKVLDLVADLIVNVPAIQSLNTHSAQNIFAQTYQYIFSRSTVSDLNTLPHWFKGATHAGELAYLFGIQKFSEVLNLTITEEDIDLADTIMKYWTNFAKTGNPNSKSLPHWPAYTKDTMEFMDLNLNVKHEEASSYFKQRMDFWLQDVPKMMESTKTSEHEEL